MKRSNVWVQGGQGEKDSHAVKSNVWVRPGIEKNSALKKENAVKINEHGKGGKGYGKGVKKSWNPYHGQSPGSWNHRTNYHHTQVAKYKSWPHPHAPPQPKPTAKNISAKQYLYGSIYSRSADGFKLVRSQPSAPAPPPQRLNRTLPPQPPEEKTVGVRVEAVQSVALAPEEHARVSTGSVLEDIITTTTTTKPITTTTMEPEGTEKECSAQGPGLSRDKVEPPQQDDEDMEAALKRARRHLAASGHIARALAKQNTLSSSGARSGGGVYMTKPQTSGRRAAAALQPGLCSFFMRTGICAHGDRCQFVHDESAVAVCAEFLRRKDGCARGAACPLSHDTTSCANKAKMPVCTSFLKGVCTDAACPYRHVKVNRTAQFCSAFLRGQCDRGDDCPLKHASRVTQQRGGHGSAGVPGTGGRPLKRPASAPQRTNVASGLPKASLDKEVLPVQHEKEREAAPGKASHGDSAVVAQAPRVTNSGTLHNEEEAAGPASALQITGRSGSAYSEGGSPVLPSFE